MFIEIVLYGTADYRAVAGDKIDAIETIHSDCINCDKLLGFLVNFLVVVLQIFRKRYLCKPLFVVSQDTSPMAFFSSTRCSTLTLVALAALVVMPNAQAADGDWPHPFACGTVISAGDLPQVAGASSRNSAMSANGWIAATFRLDANPSAAGTVMRRDPATGTWTDLGIPAAPSGFNYDNLDIRVNTVGTVAITTNDGIQLVAIRKVGDANWTLPTGTTRSSQAWQVEVNGLRFLGGRANVDGADQPPQPGFWNDDFSFTDISSKIDASVAAGNVDSMSGNQAIAIWGTASELPLDEYRWSYISDVTAGSPTVTPLFKRSAPTITKQFTMPEGGTATAVDMDHNAVVGSTVYCSVFRTAPVQNVDSHTEVVLAVPVASLGDFSGAVAIPRPRPTDACMRLGGVNSFGRVVGEAGQFLAGPGSRINDATRIAYTWTLSGGTTTLDSLTGPLGFSQVYVSSVADDDSMLNGPNLTVKVPTVAISVLDDSVSASDQTAVVRFTRSQGSTLLPLTLNVSAAIGITFTPSIITIPAGQVSVDVTLTVPDTVFNDQEISLAAPTPPFNPTNLFNQAKNAYNRGANTSVTITNSNVDFNGLNLSLKYAPIRIMPEIENSGTFEVNWATLDVAGFTSPRLEETIISRDGWVAALVIDEGTASRPHSVLRRDPATGVWTNLGRPVDATAEGIFASEKDADLQVSTGGWVSLIYWADVPTGPCSRLYGPSASAWIAPMNGAEPLLVESFDQNSTTPRAIAWTYNPTDIAASVAAAFVYNPDTQDSTELDLSLPFNLTTYEHGIFASLLFNDRVAGSLSKAISPNFIHDEFQGQIGTAGAMAILPQANFPVVPDVAGFIWNTDWEIQAINGSGSLFDLSSEPTSVHTNDGTPNALAFRPFGGAIALVAPPVGFNSLYSQRSIDVSDGSFLVAVNQLTDQGVYVNGFQAKWTAVGGLINLDSQFKDGHPNGEVTSGALDGALAIRTYSNNGVSSSPIIAIPVPMVSAVVTANTATEGGANASVKFTRTGSILFPLTVRFTTDNVANLVPTVGSIKPNNVTFVAYYEATIPAGQTFIDVPLMAVNDSTVEGDLLAHVLLQPGGVTEPNIYNANVNQRNHGLSTYEFLDTDLAVTVFSEDLGSGGGEAAISATTPTISEGGGAGQFRVTLAAPAPAGGQLVKIAVSGNASRGVDYALKINGNLLPSTGNVQVIIPEFLQAVDIEVESIDDASPEADELVSLVLVSVGSNLTPLASSATMTIEHSDFNYFVLWVERRAINNRPDQGEAGAINLWLEAAPGKTIQSTTFTFPGGRVVGSALYDDGHVADVDEYAFGRRMVSLTELEAGVPNGTYRADIVYTDTTTEVRVENATFAWNDWQAYPVPNTLTHLAADVVANVNGRVTAHWTASGPLAWVSLNAFNGPIGNTGRDRFESPVGNGTSFEIPVQVMPNQPYLLDFNRMDNTGRMGSLTQIGFSTGPAASSLPTFAGDSGNLTNTVVGNILDGNYSMRHKPQVGAVTSFSRSVSRETIKQPGTDSDVATVKVHEVQGANSTTEWLARDTTNALQVVRSEQNGVNNSAGVPERLIPGGASVGTQWFAGYDDELSELVSLTDEAPTAQRPGSVKVSLGNGKQVLWFQPDFGVVEVQQVDATVGIDFMPLIQINLPVITGSGTLTVSEDQVSAGTVSLTAADIETPNTGLAWVITSAATKGLAALSSATGGASTLSYTPGVNEFGSDSVTVKVTDGDGGFSTKTITISITAVNDLPSFTKGADQSVTEDVGSQSVVGWATALSAGPANESAQTLSFTVSNNNTALFSSQPAVASNGTLTFTPAANVNGTATVSVAIGDSAGASSATRGFSIEVSAVNDLPVNTGVPVVTMSGNDASVTNGVWNDVLDGNPGTITFAYKWFTNAAVGSGIGTEAVGTTVATFVGASPTHLFVRCEVTATDGGSPLTASATVSSAWIKTNNVLPTITGTPGTVNATEDTVVTNALNVTANDSDGASSSIAWIILTPATKGSVTRSPATGATTTLSFTPAVNASGADSVTLRAIDVEGGIVDVVVSIVITPVNDAPQFTKGTALSVNEGSGAFSAPWATGIAPGPVGATDESGQTVAFIVTAATPSLFEVQPEVAPNGVLTFTPKVGAAGSSVIHVKLVDNGGTANQGVDTSAIQSATISIVADNEAPIFTRQPTQVITAVGTTATFEVAASGLPAPTFQWQRAELGLAFVNIPGATAVTFTTAPVTVAVDNGAQYRCVATNSEGIVPSLAAILTVTTNVVAPVITSQPSDVDCSAGSSFSLAVSVTGSPVPTVQWQRRLSGVFADIAGATNLAFSVARAATTQSGDYRCVVTNSGGVRTSNEAAVTVSVVTFPILKNVRLKPAGLAQAPTPAIFTLGVGDVLQYVDGVGYEAVGVNEPLTVGGCYFLANGSTPSLSSLYELVDLTDPAPLVIEDNGWNIVTVTVNNELGIDGGITPLELTQLEGVEAVWLVDPTTGTMQFIADPQVYFGANGGTSIPAGSLLWIETTDFNAAALRGDG